MIFTILGDSHWEARVDSGLDLLESSAKMAVLQETNYGRGLNGMSIILMCRGPELVFKQRIRLRKADMTLYVDIMLDLYQMRDADDEGRRQHIASRIGQGLPPILKKYALRDFDEATFLRDFRAWLGACGQPKDT